MKNRNIQNSKESDLAFRIAFREEFGVDWNEAFDDLHKDKEETERKWQQTLLIASTKSNNL